MNYSLSNAAEQFSPSLVVFPDRIAANIRAVVAAAGSPERLRPHAKTHKTVEIARMLLLHGVHKHKCATIAEAEMLAIAGAADVLIAYPLIGPNVARLAMLKEKYPATQFASLVDHPANITALPRGAAFVLDLDVGQHRTGTAIESAFALFEMAIDRGLVPFGLQTYDGHTTQESRADREAAVREWLQPVLALRSRLEANGWPVPRIIAGGTPNFPVLAAIRDVPGLECSPGTFVLHDHGYESRYPDIAGVEPAAVLMTRVVSRPTPTRVTLDLGTKAIASDPPLAKRVRLLDFPPHELVLHSEEHLVVETAEAERFQPGDIVYALPGHVCPTVALHRDLLVAEGGAVVGAWNVLARDRVITI